MLELATLEKDVEGTLHIMDRMLNNLESIGAFAKSPLYSHMTFSPIGDDYLKEVRDSLISAFSDEDNFEGSGAKFTQGECILYHELKLEVFR